MQGRMFINERNNYAQTKWEKSHVCSVCDEILVEVNVIKTFIWVVRNHARLPGSQTADSRRTRPCRQGTDWGWALHFTYRPLCSISGWLSPHSSLHFYCRLSSVPGLAVPGWEVVLSFKAGTRAFDASLFTRRVISGLLGLVPSPQWQFPSSSFHSLILALASVVDKRLSSFIALPSSTTS